LRAEVVTIVEFLVKPVELFGKYVATPTAVASASSVTNVLVDIYGRQQVVGAAAAGSSTADINPILIAGVDTAGSLTPLKVSTAGTLFVDTELSLAADNITIENVKVFSDAAGTQDFALIDGSRQIILSPSSTVTVASIASTSDVAIVSHAVQTPTDAQAVYQSPATVWSSYNVTSASTNTWIAGDGVDISTFITKTISYYATFTGTLQIQTTPTSSTATWYNYYTDNSVAANTYHTYSFTEAQYWARLRIYTSTTGTVDAWIVRQVG